MMYKALTYISAGVLDFRARFVTYDLPRDNRARKEAVSSLLARS